MRTLGAPAASAPLQQGELGAWDCPLLSRAQLNVLEAHSEMLCEMLQTRRWHGESRATIKHRAAQPRY